MREEELRRHVRTNFQCRLKITHPTIGERIVTTRDISDGGVYLELETELIPPLGSRLRGQVQGLAEEAPLLEMEVVRVDASGIGLRFVSGD